VVDNEPLSENFYLCFISVPRSPDQMAARRLAIMTSAARNI